MYEYDKSDRPRMWRPDLVPHILTWIESVPSEEWECFTGFRVGDRGQFVAEFEKRPDRGGPPRRITHRFDHKYHTIENDVGRWTATDIVPFVPGHLQDIANYF